jgi:diguanylate cyclase (GGDEF)-like protein
VGEGVRILVEQREELLLEDPPNSPFIPAPLRQVVQARSALAAPLVSEGEVAGVLSVGTGAGRPFTPEEAGLLRRFSDAAGSALGRARLLARMEGFSMTDSLTGLPNRRHVELHLERELAAARRGRALSVVLFDVDSFRRYNDTLGRVAGDEVLRTMGEVLAAETRAMNLVGRYGGDEFLAILSDTPREGAELHAERVEERVARHSGLGPHGITVSSGVATFSEDMKSLQDLIRAADRDLRQAQAAPADALE